jgi:hypothetical protein
MIRLSRAGRKQAVISALKILHAKKKLGGYTRGEICKQMGITSQSKIRDLLHEMVAEHRIVMGTSAIDSYAHEIEIFALIPVEQKRMFHDAIKVNGVLIDWHEMESVGV